MTPAALLVGFCAVMSAIAIGRLALEDERNPIDVGAMLVVLGITVLSALWATIREPLFSTTGRLLLAVVGLGTIGVGIVVLARHWNAVDAGSSRRGHPDDTDGESDCA